MGISDFTPFAVIFAVLPYETPFCLDCKTEYSSIIISRIGTKHYIRHRLASVALSGTMVMGTIMFIITVFCQSVAGFPKIKRKSMFP